jgi:hypothetical protein
MVNGSIQKKKKKKSGGEHGDYELSTKRPSLAYKRLWIMYKNNFQKSQKNVLKIQIKPG